MQIILSIKVKEISVRAIRQWLDNLRLSDLESSGIRVEDVYIADSKGELNDTLEREGLKVI